MTTIRPLTSADADALLDLTDYAFIADPGRPWRESLLEQVDFNNTFGAFRDGEQVGGYLFYDLMRAEPGPLGTVCAQPLPGLSWVSVHPDHRRRGVLSAMIRHHLADLRERGAAWSGLTASDPRIYGRFGYAVATLAVRYRVRQGARLDVPEAVARIRAALRSGEPIVVYGDFDADGDTSTALLVQALSALGGQVSVAQARTLSGQCRLRIGIAWRGAANYLVPGLAHVPDQYTPEVAHGFGLVAQNNDLHARRSPLFGACPAGLCRMRKPIALQPCYEKGRSFCIYRRRRPLRLYSRAATG